MNLRKIYDNSQLILITIFLIDVLIAVYFKNVLVLVISVAGIILSIYLKSQKEKLFLLPMPVALSLSTLLNPYAMGLYLIWVCITIFIAYKVWNYYEEKIIRRQ